MRFTPCAGIVSIGTAVGAVLAGLVQPLLAPGTSQVQQPVTLVVALGDRVARVRTAGQNASVAHAAPSFGAGGNASASAARHAD